MPINQTRSSLLTESASLFPDNNTQEISPADLRSWIADGTTSFVTQKDKSTLENAIYESKSSSLASAATTDLSLASGNYVHITGTTTITSFGTCSAGSRFVLVFDDVLILTYNATSLIIPGSANKTTAAGDACMIISEGSGNWKIVGYFSISGSGGGSGTVTSITAGTGLSGGTITTSGTIALANTAVTPAAYTNANITVDAQGRITYASNGTTGGTPGGSDTQIQYNNGGSFGGVNDITWDDTANVLTINNPRIGQSIGNGHFHMHTINVSAPSGVTDYVTLYADKSPKQIGARFETDAYTSALQFGATADRVYSLPDATGNVLVDTVIPSLNNGTSAGEIRLKEATTNGSNYVAIKSPASLAADYTLTLPADDGASAQVLQTDGAGLLSWVNQTPSAGISRINATTTGTAVTGTTAKTKTLSVLVPANTFGAGTILQLSAFGIRTAGTTNGTMRIEANTSDAIGGTLVANYVYTGSNSWFKMQREFIISNSTTDTSGFPITASGVLNDNSAVVAAIASNAIDWTIDQYIVVSMQNGNNADSTYCRAISILQK